MKIHLDPQWNIFHRGSTVLGFQRYEMPGSCDSQWRDNDSLKVNKLLLPMRVKNCNQIVSLESYLTTVPKWFHPNVPSFQWNETALQKRNRDTCFKTTQKSIQHFKYLLWELRDPSCNLTIAGPKLLSTEIRSLLKYTHINQFMPSSGRYIAWPHFQMHSLKKTAVVRLEFPRSFFEDSFYNHWQHARQYLRVGQWTVGVKTNVCQEISIGKKRDWCPIGD